MLQTLLGAWPIELDRVEEYLVKATREAKRRTTWTDPEEAYEARVVALARAALDDPLLRGAVIGLVESSAEATRATVLGQKLLQLTLPGVPDVYQGCEIVDLSLVDPDNRRPVDHVALAERLERLDAGEPPADLDDEKLLVTSRTLRLRRDDPGMLGPARRLRAAARHRPAPGGLRTRRCAHPRDPLADPVGRGRRVGRGHRGAARGLLDRRAHRPASWQAATSRSRSLFADLPVALLTARAEAGLMRPAVWAPAAGAVDLVLDDGTVAMTAGAGGWWHADRDLAPGTRYRFAARRR